VLSVDLPPDLVEKIHVLQDFLPTISDVGGNLIWGMTLDDTTPRWILIE
jgi:hypothetical protein